MATPVDDRRGLFGILTSPRVLWRRAKPVMWRAVHWSDRHIPAGLRTLAGLPLIAGGVFSFLPIAGLWMLPVGLALIALDVPALRRRLLSWMHRHHPDRDGTVLDGKVSAGEDRAGKEKGDGMVCTVFLAGAGGAVGRRLAPLLVEAGYRVVGSTRSAARVESLAALGIEAVQVDVFDEAALTAAMTAARPEIVIHQLTDLPYGLDPALMEEGLVRNARIRVDGTRNLIAAARAAGARRLIAQSIAWLYAPGPEPHGEDDALDAVKPASVTLEGVLALERQVLEAAPLEGIVLRYGMFYGPGTGSTERSGGPARVHVDAAAQAALLAIDRARPGVYNIADPGDYLSSEKARRDLGWTPDFRRDGE